MHICVITDNKTSHSSTRFFEEARVNNVKMTFVSWKDVFLNKEGTLLCAKMPLKKFDAVILRSSVTSLTPSILVVEYCKYHNIRLLNEKFYFRYQTVNKLRQQLIFQMKKIPCLKIFYGENVHFSFLKKELGLPFIAKLATGSMGKQVFKISSKKEFESFFCQQKDDKQLCLFQKFYHIDADYRVFIIGKRVFGPIKRIAPNGEWKTNARGAKHERVEKKEQVLALAMSVAKKTGIEFAGVDILIDSANKPRVIEINTMADFKVFDEVYPEINIAKETIALLAL